MESFIDDHREAYGVEPICRVLPIAPSVYYEQKARQADPLRLPARLARDIELRVEIERVWKENQSVYGARKVCEPAPIPAAFRRISCSIGRAGGSGAAAPAP